MRSNIAFRLSAQNSLRMNEIATNKDANLNNTFKAGSDLRSQLNKTKVHNKTTKIGKGNETFEKQQRKSEQEALAQQVAALDHFKAPVVREKTKNMIENIKLRRRQKHIDTMNRFHQDLDDYKENLFNIYSSLTNDLSQVMSIKLSTMEDYFKSCENQDYLLSREKDLINEINEQVSSYQIQCQTKLNYSRQQLERIKNSRGTIVSDTCSDLRQALIEIAFVLEDEAREIEEKQKTDIQKIQSKYYEQYSQKANTQTEAQGGRNEQIRKRADEVINKWKQTKEDYQIKSYTDDAESDQYRRPTSLRYLYDQLMSLQMQNHNRKVTLMNNIIKEDPDTYSKSNIDKFNEQLKKINDHFDDQLDNLINLFITAKKEHKEKNDNRYTHLKNRMVYIENHNEEEIQEILKSKCYPLLERNISEQEQLMKKSTAYVQSHDDKQNKVLGAFSHFILKIGQQNDTFIKDFGKLNTDYEIQKAKILDNDEQLVEKLNEELDKLKIQLKEALHHIKLEEVQKKCFQKVDQIEKAYRQCHENNKKLKETRTPSLEQFMKKYEAKLAEIMQLFDPSRRAELQQKNKQEAEQKVLKMIELQEKKKAEQQARLIEEAKAKGGKPPAPAKPKDPKKAAAELEERKKVLLSELGTKAIEELKSDTGSTWLVFRTIEEICKGFYQIKQQQKPQEAKEGGEEVQPPVAPQQFEQQKIKALDAPDEELKDCRGQAVVTQKAYIRLQNLIPGVSELRQKLFDTVASKKSRIIDQSEDLDEEMLDESLTTLDTRLKAHYSLKGTIESEIYVKRSGQITNHKKKYEKYARTIKDKMDLQTQKFNFLLQKGLQTLKQHNTEQKKMKQHIPKCKNLSQLQGMYSRTRQNSNSFGMTIKQIYHELDRLSGYEVDVLLEKNQNFIKDSKKMSEGGDYSGQEISWYEEMMGQITKQMKQQQEKRKEKLQQLKNHCEKRKKQLLQAFEKQYTLAIEQTAAKDGTGKKYGRPKRIAQEKTRLQMNKCEQAQINIDKLISEFGKDYQINMQSGFHYNQDPPTLQWRRKLMTIQTCIMRYGKHIQAFKPDLKIEPMERVNYDESQSTSKLLPDDEEKDKQRKDSQLKALGRLYDQKDDRVFMKYIEEIEKIISDESRNIYVGDKAKHLTGNDKIPDFLRIYIANMKSNAQAFRISCIRDLRESCAKLADLSKCLSELIFSSILSFSKNSQILIQHQTLQKLQKFISQHKMRRADNMKKLRPNLLNPKCQNQLKQLDENESKRKQQYENISKALEKQFKDQLFSKADDFLNKIFNNFQFLLTLTNSFYLYEDFVQCPGDEIQQKNHLDIQRLMVMKQKGIKIDPTSERNLKRKWEGLDFTVFNIDDRKYEYKKVNSEEQPKQKDKKAGKKDSKDPKKQSEEPIEGDPSKSRTIQTFKTWRQKSVFENRNRVYEEFKGMYQEIFQKMLEKITNENKDEISFGLKWRQTADSLYIK